MPSSKHPPHKIIHIDMDCFYAAIEMRDNPSLINKPMAVGGSANKRGVLCTSNYVARKFGVRSAMATGYALKLCPHLTVLPVKMDKYKNASRAIHKIFSQYTDIIEPLSLDEAYLDVSNCDKKQGSATLIAKAIQNDIIRSQGLTASAGVAPNKFLAKIASDWKKPAGLTVITPEKIDHFVAALPIKKIFGVGKVTANKMEKLNIQTCSDLQKLSLPDLIKHFNHFGERLYELCRGIDNRKVEPNRLRKSVGIEHTFIHDLKNENACLDELPELFEKLKKRLEHHSERRIKKQFVKIKFSNFQLTTIERSTYHLEFKLYQNLLKEAYKRHCLSVRLLGIGVSFDDKNQFSQQLSLLQ